MPSIRYACSYLLATFVLACASAEPGVPATSEPDPTRDEAVRLAAEGWLRLIDEGHYARSWEVTMPHVREAVSRAQWVEAMTMARGAGGAAVRERQLRDVAYRDWLPDAPRGEYAILEFRTEVEGRSPFTEVVVLGRTSEEAEWRATGYWIR